MELGRKCTNGPMTEDKYQVEILTGLRGRLRVVLWHECDQVITGLRGSQLGIPRACLLMALMGGLSLWIKF